MAQCPNITSPEWIKLTETYGETGAWLAYIANNETIPNVATSIDDVLNLKEDLSVTDEGVYYSPAGVNYKEEIEKAFDNVKVTAYPNKLDTRYDIFISSVTEEYDTNDFAKAKKQALEYKTLLTNYIRMRGHNAAELVKEDFLTTAIEAINTLEKLKTASNEDPFTANELGFLYSTLPNDHVMRQELKDMAALVYPKKDTIEDSDVHNMLNTFTTDGGSLLGYQAPLASKLATLVRTSKGRLSTLSTDEITGMMSNYRNDVKASIEAYDGGLRQQQVVEQMLRQVELISGINPETGRYIDAETGQDIARRPTDASKKLFEKNKTAEEIAEIERKNALPAKTGTEGHAVLAYYMTELAGNYSNLDVRTARPVENPGVEMLDEKLRNVLKNGAIRLLKSINAEQVKIDPNQKAVIIPELFMYDKPRNIGGTTDLVTVYSDSSVSVHDYKFVRFPEMRIKENGQWVTRVVEDHLDLYKTKSYNMQISEYTRMLKNIFGVTHFRQTRIIPIEVKYKGKKVGDNYEFTGVKSVSMMSTSKAWTDPIPVAKEFTGIENVDKVLNELYTRRDKYEMQLKKAYGDDKLVSRIKDNIALTNKTIRDLLVHQSIDTLAQNLTGIIGNVRENVEEMSLEELVNALQAVDFYIHNLPNLEALIDSNNDLDADTKKEKKQLLKSYVGEVSSVKVALVDYITLRLKEIDPNIDKRVRQMGQVDKWMYMSEVDNPVLNLAKKAINESYDKATKQTAKLVEEAKGWRDKLTSAGYNLMDVYRRFINSKTGHIFGKFSADFFQQQTKAAKEGDTAFFKKHYTLTEDGDKQFREDQYQKKKQLLEMYPKDSEQFKFRMNKWNSENDPFNDSSWLNYWVRDKYLALKNPEEHYSDEYKALQGDKTLLGFYEWHRKKNSEFNDMVAESIPERFVANIQKDAADVLSQDGNILGAIGTGFNSLVSGLQIRQNDVMRMDDTEKKIPLLYYDDFSYYNKDTGKFEQQTAQKSTDLLYNIVMFGHAVHVKHNLQEIEHVVKGLRAYLPNQTVYKVNRFGNPVPAEGTDQLETVQGDQTAIDMFDAFINAKLYGETLQDEDRAIKVGNKTISRNKLLLKLISFLSIKSLAGNYVSAVGGGINAAANGFIHGVNGTYYNKKQWNQAANMRVRNHPEFHHAVNFWRIEKENWSKKEAAKLSAGFIQRNVTYDKFYFMQQNLDEFTADQVTVAMMHSYGIDPENGNKVRKLDYLPEGTKSLMDRMKVVDDKIVIEGLSDEAYTDFRNKASFAVKRIKGTNTQDDMTYIQTKLWGRAVMHFRNWIQPMLAERFGSTKYVPEMEEWVTGRYNALVVDMMKQKVVPSLLKLAGHVASFGLYQYRSTEEAMTAAYKQFKKNNPDKEIGYEEFKLVKSRQIRAAAVEARALVLVGMLVLAMGADWDDDGTPLYREVFGLGPLYSMLDRTLAELTFWTSPKSFQEILKSPIPLMRLLLDGANFIGNTFDEGRDDLLGENDLTVTGKSKDEAERFHYLSRMNPFVGPSLRLYDELMYTFEDIQK